MAGYAMSYSVWDSDLSFDTYSDVIFFLLGFLALERGGRFRLGVSHDGFLRRSRGC